MPLHVPLHIQLAHDAVAVRRIEEPFHVEFPLPLDAPPRALPSRPLRVHRLCCGCFQFYGYAILLVATVGKVMSFPGQSSCVGAVIDPIMQSLDISRAQVSLLYLFGTVGSACALPHAGVLVDRLGMQRSIGLVSVGLGLACAYMSIVSNAPMLLLGFFLLRFLGQGMMTMVSQTAINLWFVQNRGFAMGLAGSAMSVGVTAAGPMLLTVLEQAIGWRRTYLAFSAAFVLGMAPLGALFYRDKPELYGLEPDGRTASARAPTGADAAPTPSGAEGGERSWTRREALRSGAFWAFSLSSCSVAATATAFFFHLTSIIEGSGAGEKALHAVYTTLTVTSVVTRMASGMLVDRVPERYMQACALALQALTYAVPAARPSFGVGTASVIALCQGVSMGLFHNVVSTVYASFFGRDHLGAISGVANAMVVLGSALGPFPFGVVYDLTGTYTSAFVGASLLSCVLSVLVLRAGRPPTALPLLHASDTLSHVPAAHEIPMDEVEPVAKHASEAPTTLADGDLEAFSDGSASSWDESRGSQSQTSRTNAPDEQTGWTLRTHSRPRSGSLTNVKPQVAKE